METYPLRVSMGIALPNAFVITGHQGKLIRQELIDRLLSYPEGMCLYLDFSEVDLIDFTGADELIAVLQARIKSREVPDRSICLIHLKPQHIANIQAALDAKKLASVYLDEDHTPQVLGTLNAYLSKTFDYVTRRKQVYSRQMADDMNIPANTSATRLLNLYYEHLVLRRDAPGEQGGKQYLYLSF